MAPTPRMMFNDDGWILGTYGPPLTPDIMMEKMIAPYEGSPVDVFLWSIGGHEVYDYESEVGERFGDGRDDLDEQQQRRKDNLHFLTEEHGGPVTVISQLCHQQGMRFFPSVRMNEHYDMEESGANFGRLRREHPELLIGKPGEEIPHLSLEWGIRTGLDYATDGTRRHMLSIIFELIERFDIDGIELDFMRHPAFFRIEEAFAQRYLATDLLRQVRNKLDEEGRRTNRELSLAVRVPPTLRDCIRIGLDVEEWIRQDLIHLLIAGGGFIPFDMPIRSFVEAARDSSCKVYGCFEALRPMLDDDAMRAIAARYWAAGVDGLYFFNYYSMSGEWKRDFLAQLADPVGLARSDKQYQMDSSIVKPESQLGFSFANAIPKVQLPVRLLPTPGGRGVVLSIDVSDDVNAASAAGALGCCTLGLGFKELPTDCAPFLVALNGDPFQWTSHARPAQAWNRACYEPNWNVYPSSLTFEPVQGELIEFDISNASLRQGVNEVEIRLETGEALDLVDVRLWIRYQPAG
jgi:hypothetical protein